MRLDRLKDKCDEDTRVWNTCLFRGLANNKIGCCAFRSSWYSREIRAAADRLIKLIALIGVVLVARNERSWCGKMMASNYYCIFNETYFSRIYCTYVKISILMLLNYLKDNKVDIKRYVICSKMMYLGRLN